MEILNFLLGTVDRTGELNSYSPGVLSAAVIISVILSYVVSVCLVLWNFAMANSAEEKSNMIKNWWGYEKSQILALYYCLMYQPVLSTMLHVVAISIVSLFTKSMILMIEKAPIVPIALLVLIPFTIVLFCIRSKNMKLKQVERKLTEE